MNKKGHYKFNYVTHINEDKSKIQWTLLEWTHKIEANFEQRFYVIKGLPNERSPDLINKVRFSKDLTLFFW